MLDQDWADESHFAYSQGSDNHREQTAGSKDKRIRPESFEALWLGAPRSFIPGLCIVLTTKVRFLCVSLLPSATNRILLGNSN